MVYLCCLRGLIISESTHHTYYNHTYRIPCTSAHNIAASTARAVSPYTPLLSTLCFLPPTSTSSTTSFISFYAVLFDHAPLAPPQRIYPSSIIDYVLSFLFLSCGESGLPGCSRRRMVVSRARRRLRSPSPQPLLLLLHL